MKTITNYLSVRQLILFFSLIAITRPLLASTRSNQMFLPRKQHNAIVSKDVKKVDQVDPNKKKIQIEDILPREALNIDVKDIIEPVFPEVENIIRRQDLLGDTLLHRASRFRKTEIVRSLIRSYRKGGFSVDQTNKMGKTALHLASEGSLRICPEIIKLLIQEGEADVNHKDIDGITPFFSFIRRLDLYEDIIELFFNYGADATVREKITGNNIFFLIAQTPNFITLGDPSGLPFITNQRSKIDCFLKIFSGTEKSIKQVLYATTGFNETLIDLLLSMCGGVLSWLDTNAFGEKISDTANQYENNFYYYFLQALQEKGSMKRMNKKVIRDIIDTTKKKRKNTMHILKPASSYNPKERILKVTLIDSDLFMRTCKECKEVSDCDKWLLKSTIVDDFAQKQKGIIWKRKYDTFVIVEDTVSFSLSEVGSKPDWSIEAYFYFFCLAQQKKPRQIMIFNFGVGRYFIFRCKPQRKNVDLSTLFTKKNKPIVSKFRENTNFIGSASLLLPKRPGLVVNIGYNRQPTLLPLELPKEAVYYCFTTNDQDLITLFILESIALTQAIGTLFLCVF